MITRTIRFIRDSFALNSNTLKILASHLWYDRLVLHHEWIFTRRPVILIARLNRKVENKAQSTFSLKEENVNCKWKSDEWNGHVIEIKRQRWNISFQFKFPFGWIFTLLLTNKCYCNESTNCSAFYFRLETGWTLATTARKIT